MPLAELLTFLRQAGYRGEEEAMADQSPYSLAARKAKIAASKPKAHILGKGKASNLQNYIKIDEAHWRKLKKGSFVRYKKKDDPRLIFGRILQNPEILETPGGGVSREYIKFTVGFGKNISYWRLNYTDIEMVYLLLGVVQIQLVHTVRTAVVQLNKNISALHRRLTRLEEERSNTAQLIQTVAALAARVDALEKRR